MNPKRRSAAAPRSMSLNLPLMGSKMMFSGLTSRRMIPVACAALRLSRTCPKIVEMILALRLLPLGSPSIATPDLKR